MCTHDWRDCKRHGEEKDEDQGDSDEEDEGEIVPCDEIRSQFYEILLFFISMSNVDLTVPESVYITGQR